MFKKVFWQGRNERRGEAYCCMYVEPRSEVRTQPEAFFNRRRKGATGFDGDTDSHRGMSSSRGLVKPPGKCNCQSRTGTRSLISCDVLPSEARGGGRARCSGLVQGWCSAAEDETILG